VLLDRGADVKAREAAHGQTALMFAAALNRDEVIRILMARGAEPNAASAVRKVERVRFDQDGNIVEERAAAPAAKVQGTAAQGAATQTQADDAAEAQAADAAAKAGSAAAKAANDAAKADLDVLARGLGFKAAEFRLAKPRPRAGDVAARAPRRVGPEVTGGMTALLYAAREGHMEAARALVESGADLNQVNGDKFSPLVMAITNGHFELAK